MHYIMLIPLGGNCMNAEDGQSEIIELGVFGNMRECPEHELEYKNMEKASKHIDRPGCAE
jgi:hypothetical protein